MSTSQTTDNEEEIRLMKDLSPAIRPLLRKMCALVGVSNADASTFNFGQKDWYMRHTWDEETEAKFVEWAVKYLKTHPGIRRQLVTGLGGYSAARTKEAMRWFCFMYGWSYKETKHEHA